MTRGAPAIVGPSTNRAPGGLADFKRWEIAVAVSVALLVQVGAGIGLHIVNTQELALPEIDRGSATPVRVTPVLDLDAPLLKLGGKRNKLKLPDQWVRQAPKPRVEEKAFVSTKAGKEEKDIPPPDVKVADAGTEPDPPDAEVAKQVDTEITEPIDAGEAANVDTEGHSDGVAEGTETDPLKARAVDLYRSRIASWFSGRFGVRGSGLPMEELLKLRVVAQVTLSADRTVTGYTMTPSGNAAFDGAARSMLEGTKGSQIPPPPANYPDTAVPSVNLTLVCNEKKCD